MTWILWEKAPGELAIYPEEAFDLKHCDRFVSSFRGSLEECRVYAGIFHGFKVSDVMEKAPERKEKREKKEEPAPEKAAPDFMLPLEDFTDETKKNEEPKKRKEAVKKEADPEKILVKDYNVAGQMSLFDLLG